MEGFKFSLIYCRPGSDKRDLHGYGKDLGQYETETKQPNQSQISFVSSASKSLNGSKS